MRALDIKTESVVPATPEMTIHDVATLFVDNHIGGMPVVDATGKVVRIVSDGDFLHRIENGAGRSKRAWWLEILSSPREQAAPDDRRPPEAPPVINGEAPVDAGLRNAIAHELHPGVIRTC